VIYAHGHYTVAGYSRSSAFKIKFQPRHEFTFESRTFYKSSLAMKKVKKLSTIINDVVNYQTVECTINIFQFYFRLRVCVKIIEIG